MMEVKRLRQANVTVSFSVCVLDMQPSRHIRTYTRTESVASVLMCILHIFQAVIQLLNVHFNKSTTVTELSIRNIPRRQSAAGV
jgi:hypothetical protein